ncbi:MAG TPA: protein translocase subunit SecF [Patescibacteria group bacterium]|nr:protein translocase subunit SecF [Patescibacteria group bacterium]
MEFFHNPNFDFLGKKAYFVGLSLVLTTLSIVSLATRGLQYGIDFRGGADVVLTFAQDTGVDQIRKVLTERGFEGAQIQTARRAEDPSAHDILIRVPPQPGTSEEAAEAGDVSGKVLSALRAGLLGGEEATGRIDLNLAGATELRKALEVALPHQDSMINAAVDAITAYRASHGGLIKSMDEARGITGVAPEVSAWMKDHAVVGGFAIRSVDYVGPSVGKELKTKATYAILGSLLAMLAYIWFRFDKLAYGISAAVTLAHDAIVALGAVSLSGKEFDLTVLAAILTIVGYSINDTIVTFDRVRENVKHRRGIGLERLFNDSINQTLGRTILTSGLVIMMVLVLWLFGGSRLNPFSFTLLVGVITGTYSTIYISSPVVIWWRTLVEKKTTA